MVDKFVGPTSEAHRRVKHLVLNFDTSKLNGRVHPFFWTPQIMIPNVMDSSANIKALEKKYQPATIQSKSGNKVHSWPLRSKRVTPIFSTSSLLQGPGGVCGAFDSLEIRVAFSIVALGQNHTNTGSSVGRKRAKTGSMAVAISMNWAGRLVGKMCFLPPMRHKVA